MRILSATCFLLLGTLSLAAQTACIEGRVLDSGGAPIPDIQIIGIGPRWAAFTTGTDRDGHFRIANLSAGNYGIATGEEFPDFYKLRFADPADVKNIALVTVTAIVDGCSSVTLHRPERAHIHLLAKDALTIADVSTAQAIFRYNAQTSWNRNRYRNEQNLIVPPLMELQLQAGASGYEDSPILTIPALQPGETRELPLSLRPLQKGCISGQVVDQLGAPVGGVSVQPELVVDRMDRFVSYKATDKGGRFRFEGVHPGEYSIGTDAPQLGYSWIPGHDNDLRITVEPSAGCKDVTINLGPKGAKIELKVVDAQTQRSLTGFVVFVSGALANGGKWVRRFDAPPMLVPALKPLNVSAERNGYRASKEVGIDPLQPEETRKITIELYPSAGGVTKSQH